MIIQPVVFVLQRTTLLFKITHVALSVLFLGKVVCYLCEASDTPKLCVHCTRPVQTLCDQNVLRQTFHVN